MRATTVEGIQIRGQTRDRDGEILTGEAVEFLADLHRTFEARRRSLLTARAARQKELERGAQPGFREDTQEIRDGDWTVPEAPADLRDRRVEITGPVDRKMMINALNSGAKVFMADFEDAHTPTWRNNLDGQANLVDAIEGTIEFEKDDGTVYRLDEETATLVVRPRGWHLTEDHLEVDGDPISASLFDAGLYLFHNAKRLTESGSGPYFYLPKLEAMEEAALWNDVFEHAQKALGLPVGTIRATVLIETVLAAFEMDEILHALGPHATGLNAGRWDYIFSLIKKFRHDEDAVLPDRGQVTMTVPFMRAYTELMVRTCHRRGAHAIGGMAAFIPNKRDPEVTENALAKVRQDKEREAGDGCDGTWVAHPGLVPVAQEVFDRVLGDQPNQLDRQREDVEVAAEDLVNLHIEGSTITQAGVRQNIDVGIRYLASWLAGRGAAAIHNLMEDTATAEISRSQIWQWVHHGATLDDGTRVDSKLVRDEVAKATAELREEFGREAYEDFRFDEARDTFLEVALTKPFVEFLTIPAYERIKEVIR